MKTYKNDPRWLTARYAGTCAKTGERFAAGTRIFYYPATRSAFVGAAAEAASADFTACVQDEESTGWMETQEAAHNERDYI